MGWMKMPSKSLKLLAFMMISWGAACAHAALPVKAAPQKSLSELFVSTLREQLSEKMALPQSLFTIQVDSFTTEPAWNGPATSVMQILGVGAGNFRRVDGLFQTPILIQGPNGSVQLQAMGLLKVVGPAFVARQAILRGQNLTQNDLEQTVMPWSTLPTGVAAQPWQSFVGLRVRSHVGPGQPIAMELLEEPLAIQNGEIVELTLFSGPGVMIRSRAIAKQEGRVGDVIRLEQPDTKKIMSGAIVGKKSVEVRM